LREIDFDRDGLRIGPFKAFDFFRDGSFYLLDSPGHAIGHLAGLARTTKNPDTFIMMGGDLCHHGGEIRPSRFMAIPKKITISGPPTGAASECPGSVLENLKRSRGEVRTDAFFLPAMGLDIPEAISTIRKAQIADHRDDVLFVYAHDTTLRGVVNTFPASANDWKQHGWGSALRWQFLQDFQPAITLS
jgi:glyoxylase-like metal-dependent hydrolase (beta-lactamase superfamily II)